MNSRISDIQQRILALQGRTAAPAQPATGSTPAQPGGDSFASHLQDAVAASSNPVGGGYRLNSAGIPAELARYGNGRIPPGALERVGNTGHRLWAPAARSLTRMMADAAKDGVSIGINESYRPYAEQVDLARRKGLYSEGGLAAKPGTSEHGWGMAADLDLNGRALSWMKENAGRYGFVDNVARESWHWAYKPNGV